MAKKRGGDSESARLIGEKAAGQFGYELVEASMEKEPAGLYLRFFLEGISKNLMQYSPKYDIIYL